MGGTCESLSKALHYSKTKPEKRYNLCLLITTQTYKHVPAQGRHNSYIFSSGKLGLLCVDWYSQGAGPSTFDDKLMLYLYIRIFAFATPALPIPRRPYSFLHLVRRGVLDIYHLCIKQCQPLYYGVLSRQKDSSSPFCISSFNHSIT